MIRVCKSVLARYYNNYEGTDPSKMNLNKPTDKFEQCGAWNDPDPVLQEILDENGNYDGRFHVVKPDPWLVFPKGSFKNAEEFYGGFLQAEIPFMYGFSIMAVDNFDEDGNKNVCYGYADSLTSVLPVVLAATVLNFLI